MCTDVENDENVMFNMGMIVGTLSRRLFYLSGTIEHRSSDFVIGVFEVT